MRTTPLLLSALLATSCLFNNDRDDDGLTNAEERELGTDPKNADTDGDGLNDGLEVNTLGTDPLLIDTDGDGLQDGHEVNEYGTDPTEPDSDFDGFDDGEEIDFGSDPLDHMSYERSTDGRWPDLRDYATGEPEGWGMGQRVTDFEGTDQFGGSLTLEMFAGNVILVDFGAGWCGPCRTVARTAEAKYRGMADDGFLIIHYMTDDNTGGGGITDDNFIAEWADQYGLTFPVVRDDSLKAMQAASNGGLYQGGIPFMMLLDQDLKVVGSATGAGSESRLEAQAATLLGVN